MARHLTTDQRGRIGEKLMEWANLVFAGLVIGQTFSANFQVVWAVIGVALFVGVYILSIQLMKGGE